MKYLRGDLSAPVLAILVTIGIIAAGLILLAWFWWFAPQAGRAGSLQILGTPAIAYTPGLTEKVNVGGQEVNCNATLYISFRNTGNDDIVIQAVYVNGTPCTPIGKTLPLTLSPGSSDSYRFACIIYRTDVKTISGVVMTNYGSYSFTAAFIG